MDRQTTSSQLLGLPILGDLLNGILGQLASATVAQIQGLIGDLTPTQIGDLLQTATGNDLTKLLQAAQNTGDLTAALDTLLPAELASVVGGLTPAQITGLLGAGGTGSVITGLLGQATGLAGTPAASQVDALIAQVTALLGGGIPADPTDLANLASLLTTLNPLLGTSGLNPALLTPLLGAANGLLGGAPAPLAAPLQGLVTQVTVLLTPVTGGGTGTTPTATQPATTPPATLPRPAVTAPRPVAVAPGPQFTAYRAAIGPLKLNQKRSNLKFTLTCASTAPKGCLVKVSAKIAGKSVMRTTTLAIVRGKSSPITVTLSKSTTRRLKSKGGSLTITAATSFSSLSSATRTLKVKRLKKAGKKVAR